MRKAEAEVEVEVRSGACIRVKGLDGYTPTDS